MDAVRSQLLQPASVLGSGVAAEVKVDSSNGASICSKAASNNDTTMNELGPAGCYLVYESDSGGRLMLHYSQGVIPDNAVGFWAPGPGQEIQGFKFKQNAGRSELIKGIAGGDANKRKYYVGWCQFLKLAKAKNGSVIQFTQHRNKVGGQEQQQIGLPVDAYGFIQRRCCPEKLDLEHGMVNVSCYDAIAVMPKHHEFLMGVKTVSGNNFMEKGNIAGASTTMT